MPEPHALSKQEQHVALLETIASAAALSAAGGGEKARARHLARGKMLPRDRVAGVLDAGPSDLLDLALRAKQLGLVHVLVGGGVIEIDPSGLDPAEKRS